MSRRWASPRLAALLAAAAVALGMVGLRARGLLEAPELAAYDWYMRLRPGHEMADPRIVLVTVSDGDIQALGRWPMPDATLARAVDVLAARAPRAIGVDIYRDVPVPPGTDELTAALGRHPNVVAVTTFGDGNRPGIAPPTALAGTERIGFNDVVVDRGGTVRRGLLYLDDGTTVAVSFALRLATLYLAGEGVVPRPDSRDPSLLRLGPTTIHPLEPDHGGYVGLDTRGYQFMLDFHGGRGAFRSVSLTDLLAGRVDAATVRDRIVLLGVSAESVKDFYFTPYSRDVTDPLHTSGIALHAAITGQLVRAGLGAAAPIRSLREWQEWLWIAGWAAAGSAAGLVGRSPWRFALAVGGGLAGLLAGTFGAFLGGWWLPLVPAAAGGVVAAGAVTAYVSYQASVERAALMQLFARHVSPQVAETLWHEREQFLHGGRPRPQRLVATVLFTDLVDFTVATEKASPQALVDWLNEYMEAMVRHVMDRGGVVNKYIGDAIMALFGVPVPRATEVEVARDAVAAVDCALDMADTLAALNRRWSDRGRPPAAMRVGIFTGPVVAGSIGSLRRLEYTVIGDTVNTASRLESFHKEFLAPDPAREPCRILIGEPTRGYLDDRFVTEWAGEVSLKGKERPLNVYHVRGRVRR